MDISTSPTKLVTTSTARLVLLVASLLYGGVLVSGTYYNIIIHNFVGALAWRSLAFVGILLFLLLLEQCEWRWYQWGQTRAMTVGLLITRMVLFAVIAAIDNSGLSRALYPIVPFIAYFSLGKRTSYGLAFFYMAAFIVQLALFVPHWYTNKETISGILMFFIGLLFALSMAHVASEAESNRQRAEGLLSDLATTHEQLKIYAAQATELATAEERNRLARDIHDGLGHYLTAITILLEKALAFRQRDPVLAETAVHNAKRLTREALLDVRQSVGSLRLSGNTFSLSTALADLVATMNDGVITTHLEIVGNEADYVKPALIALYRAAQEAMTNIQKHAHARNVGMRVVFDDQGARVTIDDDGQGFDTTLLEHLPSHRHDRFGLQGVSERLAMIGGVLALESHPSGGTHLSASIPHHQPAVHRIAMMESSSASHCDNGEQQC